MSRSHSGVLLLMLDHGFTMASTSPRSKASCAEVGPWKPITILYLVPTSSFISRRITTDDEVGPVPAAIVDLARDEEQRQILALFAGGSPLGTALLAPPGVPDAMATTLRRGFDAAMRDPALLAEVRKAQADIDPLPGEELQKVVAGTFAVPPVVLERAQKLSLQIAGASKP